MYPKYEINRLGIIRTIKNKRTLKPRLKKGYWVVNLSKNGVKNQYSIHRLLAIEFLPNSKQLEFVDHIDRNRTNNSLSNLRWVDRLENNSNRLFIKDNPYLLFLIEDNKYVVGRNDESKYFNESVKAFEYFNSLI